MALCINKEFFDKYYKREPEQDFNDCWERATLEVKKNKDRRHEKNDEDYNLWDE